MDTGKKSWQSIAADKVADTLSKIPKEWRLDESDLKRASKTRDITGPFIEQFLDAGEKEIIHQNSVSIVENIRSGKYTALQVTRAFCKTTAIAHQINNCLHEIFFDQALQRAQELDDHFKKHGQTVGPLHGLPVSLKDQFHVKGNDTSMGFIGWLGTYEGSTDPKLVHKVDSQIVTELLSLGAVLYCKTSLPQTLLLGETENNIIGRTLNPHNHNLSCGGSSGGEGALLALRGSSIGLGTDIGNHLRLGLLRLRSHTSGILWHLFSETHPSQILISRCGERSEYPCHEVFATGQADDQWIPGETTYASSVGFMGTSLESLHLMMSSILSTEPWTRDPNVVNIPWRQQIVDATLSRASSTGSSNNQPPLKLGIYWTDNAVTPHPPITRGLHEMVKAVEAAGHKIVEWDPPSHSAIQKLHYSFLEADGGHDIHKQLDLSGEPLIPVLDPGFRLKEPMSLLKYQEMTVRGRDFEAVYSDYWQSTKDLDGQLVDAVIMPVAPHAAVIPGKYYHLAYSEAINLMDYSAVVLPVTKANKDIDKPDDNYRPLNEVDRKNWEAYDPEVYDGAPVGIQIVGRKWEEEKIWAIGKIVYECLKQMG